MKERGIATKVDGTTVSVRISLNEGCASCNSKDGCSVVGHDFLAEAAPGSTIAIGDAVDISVPDSVRASGALWLLVVPIGLFFAGYIVSGMLFPDRGEGVQALTGLAGMVLGLAGAAVAARYGSMSRKPLAVKVEPGSDSAYAN